MTHHRVLIVDDEPAVLTALHRALRRQYGPAMEVRTIAKADQALDLLRVRDFDIVLSDLRMPVLDGLTFLRLAARIRPHAVRMILTGTADFATAQQAINEAGVYRYLCKPWDDHDLVQHMDAALRVAAQGRGLRDSAQAWADRTDPPSAQELERRRLEALEPGLTDVDWGPTGEVIMPPATSFGTLD